MPSIDRGGIALIGADVRFAAQSAVSAGFMPWCCDLFRDDDLISLVPHAVECPVREYPTGLVRRLWESGCQDPVLYTGGLENYPRLVDYLHRRRHVYAPPSAALRRLRSPELIAEQGRAAGLPVLEISDRWAPVMSPGSEWLQKSRSGSAGLGVKRETAADKGSVTAGGQRRYWQRFQPGLPMSVVYVADANRPWFLGATEQLIGTEALYAPQEFIYCGNVGPVELSSAVRLILDRWADLFVHWGGARGLFGIDFVLSDDVPWLVEVNPRFPASLEVLEPAADWNAVDLHVRAFQTVPLPPIRNAGGSVHAKAIVYAPTPFVVPKAEAWLERVRGMDVSVRDRSPAGLRIEQGRPVCTVVARGTSREKVRERAIGAARRLVESPRGSE